MITPRRPDPSPPSSAAEEDPRAIQTQVERILGGVPFAKADQLRRFLAFIVNEAVEGRGSELREYVIGVRVLRKGDSFDPRTDPIVRVQARRLRAKLERYYRVEGARDPILIELPRGTYTPTIRSRTEPCPERRRSVPALMARNTIAVTPLSPLGSSDQLAAIAEGVRAEVIARLTRLPGLRIVDGDDGVDAQAALVVGGSLRSARERLRVSLDVREAATKTFLWAESFDGSTNDPLALQELAAEGLSSFLGSELEAARGSRIPHPPENMAARSFYVQGRYHLSQRTEDGLRRSVELFERSIEQDAHYALSHSGLADAYSLLGHYGVLGPADVWTKAATFAASGVLLDDGSAEAHTSLAHVRATQDWDWEGAEREFQRALSLNPRYTTAHHWYGASCLAPLGRLDDALAELLTAQELDPVSSIVARDVALMHFYRRDFGAALEQCDHTIELNPHFAPAYVTLGLIQEQRGDFDESAAALQRALQLAPGTPRIMSALARNLALAGDRAGAVQAQERVMKLSSSRYVSPLDLAWISFALGEVERGFDWLSKAFADRAFDIISAHVDPRFDSLRGDPRFGGLVAHLGITDRLFPTKQISSA